MVGKLENIFAVIIHAIFFAAYLSIFQAGPRCSACTGHGAAQHLCPGVALTPVRHACMPARLLNAVRCM